MEEKERERRRKKRDKPGYKVIQRPDPNSSLFFLSDMYLAFFFSFSFLPCFAFLSISREGKEKANMVGIIITKRKEKEKKRRK